MTQVADLVNQFFNQSCIEKSSDAKTAAGGLALPNEQIKSAQPMVPTDGEGPRKEKKRTTGQKMPFPLRQDVNVREIEEPLAHHEPCLWIDTVFPPSFNCSAFQFLASC